MGKGHTTCIAVEDYTVVNLDHGLAPEHPFLWAVEGAFYAARWVAQNAERFKGDGSRLVISGDSADVNLSAAAIVALIGFGWERAAEEGPAGARPFPLC